jgi:hypothetical protein
VVEWADRIHQALPANYQWETLKLIDDFQRDQMFVAHGNRPQALLTAFRKKVFGG